MRRLRHTGSPSPGVPAPSPPPKEIQRVSSVTWQSVSFCVLGLRGSAHD